MTEETNTEDTRLFRFPVREKQGDSENNFEIEIHAADLRTAVFEAACEATCPYGDDEHREDIREQLDERLGEGWTAGDFFAGSPDLWRGDWFVTLYEPEEHDEDDAPKEVMRRWVARQNDPGALTDALLAVIDSLGNDENERLFLREIHAQRELEKE